MPYSPGRWAGVKGENLRHEFGSEAEEAMYISVPPDAGADCGLRAELSASGSQVSFLLRQLTVMQRRYTRALALIGEQEDQIEALRARSAILETALRRLLGARAATKGMSSGCQQQSMAEHHRWLARQHTTTGMSPATPATAAATPMLPSLPDLARSGSTGGRVSGDNSGGSFSNSLMSDSDVWGSGDGLAQQMPPPLMMGADGSGGGGSAAPPPHLPRPCRGMPTVIQEGQLELPQPVHASQAALHNTLPPNQLRQHVVQRQLLPLNDPFRDMSPLDNSALTMPAATHTSGNKVALLTGQQFPSTSGGVLQPKQPSTDGAAVAAIDAATDMLLQQRELPPGFDGHDFVSELFDGVLDGMLPPVPPNGGSDAGHLEDNHLYAPTADDAMYSSNEVGGELEFGPEAAPEGGLCSSGM